MIKRLGGRYELQEQIGDGGMAVVYRAIDTLLGRPVAVKMLHAHFSGDDEFVSRFRQEATSAAKLSHPNIVSLFDVGMTDNEYYIVMEYVDGPTLKEVINERAPLSVREVVNITSQICDALECAHDHHLIHRDIKPHNILLTKSGLVKVTDFGIARAMTNNTITQHHTTSVLGSVHYFSPEQARGGMTDVKSDIYSLGVVMYEMLTGKLPFSGETAVSVALMHLREKFVEPRELNKDIPQSLENIVLRCLVKDPALRYPDMKAMKADLKDALIFPNVPKFIAPEPVTDATIAVPIVGNLGQRPAEGEPSASVEEGPVKRSWLKTLLWVVTAVVILCVGAFAAYTILMKYIQVPTVDLPNVVNMTEKQAEKALSGFNVSVQTGTNGKPKGVVYEQDPPGPTQVKQGREVTIYVSNGPPQIQMPDLQFQDVDQAEQTLVSYGINPKNIKEVQIQSTQQADTVVSTSPAAGTQISSTQTITLQVSSGGETKIPDIRTMTLSEASEALKAAGLTLGKVTHMQSTAPDQTIIDIETYKIGQQVPTGTAIDVDVADNSGSTTDNSTNTTDGSAPPDNSSGSDSGTSSTGTDANTQVQPLRVVVEDPDGKSIHVQIYKTDATTTSSTNVIDTTISQKTMWTIPVFVTSSQSGQVTVLENGVLVRNYPVNYSQQ